MAEKVTKIPIPTSPLPMYTSHLTLEVLSVLVNKVRTSGKYPQNVKNISMVGGTQNWEVLSRKFEVRVFPCMFGLYIYYR